MMYVKRLFLNALNCSFIKLSSVFAYDILVSKKIEPIVIEIIFLDKEILEIEICSLVGSVLIF